LAQPNQDPFGRIEKIREGGSLFSHWAMVLLKLLFTILSISNVFGIFLFADSPMVSDLARFNPYSLLHIPIYGILTGLLTFSIPPLRLGGRTHYKGKYSNEVDLSNTLSALNVLNTFNILRIYVLAHLRIFVLMHLRKTPCVRILSAGLIAFGVAIADEVHQLFLPSRHATMADVFLDLIGISFGMLLIFIKR